MCYLVKPSGKGMEEKELKEITDFYNTCLVKLCLTEMPVIPLKLDIQKSSNTKAAE